MMSVNPFPHSFNFVHHFCTSALFQVTSGTPCDTAWSVDGRVCLQLTFSPRRRGSHTVDVRWRRLPVTGSPLHVNAVTAHAPDYAEDGCLRGINVVDSSNSAGHVTAAVLRGTSKVGAS